MSLHDEHLRQALRHAPDSDAVPNTHTRRAVLDYAAKVTSKKSRPKRSFSVIWRRITGWPLAGLGSAMAILLVMVVFWDIQPDQTTFDETGSRQVAQAESKVGLRNSAPEDKAEEVAASVSESASAAPAVPSVVVADAVPKKTNGAVLEKQLNQVKEKDLPAATPVAKPAEGSQAVIVAAAAPPTVADKGEVSTRTEAASGEVVASGSVVNSAALPSQRKPQGADVLPEHAEGLKKADADKENDLAKLSAGNVAGESKASSIERAKTVAAAPEPKDEIADARARGAANAAKDIKAGVLRILTMAKPAEGNAIDEATGYHIEAISNRPMSETLQTEIDAYNKAMRDWHAK